MPPDRTHAVLRLAGLGAALVLTAISKWGSWQTPFVFDDWMFVLSGEAIVDGGIAQIARYAVDVFHPNEYRPLPYLLNAVDYLAWGKDPVGWSLTNLGIHLGVTALLFRLALRVTASAAVATAAASLFGTSPATAGSATIVSFREDTLATLFILAAMLSVTYTRKQRFSPAWLAAGVFSLAAMLSKEVALVAPVLALILFAPFHTDRGERRRAWTAAAVLAAPLALYAIVRATQPNMAPASAAAQLASAETWRVFAGVLHASFVYFIEMIWSPTFLATAAPDFAVAGHALVRAGLIVLLGVAAWQAATRRSALPLRGLLWALIAVSPVLGFIAFELGPSRKAPVDIARFLNEYRLYLPAVGLALVLAAPLVARARAIRSAGLVATALICATFVGESRSYVGGILASTEEAEVCASALEDADLELPDDAVLLLEDDIGLNCRLALVQGVLDEGLDATEWGIARDDETIDVRTFRVEELEFVTTVRRDLAIETFAGEDPLVVVQVTEDCEAICIERAPDADAAARMLAAPTRDCDGALVELPEISPTCPDVTPG